ncbi:hypothetical protein [Kribbella solani]|uniref:Uncharacterized protein n=1 Tax=Kribbella solani TaxID=236067 RepID=A0A841DZ89_9ACTN|nr:hypothetical protein [Kribbella solani]MBB5983291.1 hypothetical protein [Kribbella solani]
MPTESRTTSVVAALSVVTAVFGHVLAGGGGLPFNVLAPLVALTGACWLLGEYLAGERLLTVLVLAGVQLFVHVTLDAASTHDGMAMSPGIGGSLMMTGAHLGVLLAGVLAVTRTHRWVGRVLRVFARLLPRLPILRPVRLHVAAVPGSSEPWVPIGARLGSSVSGRGPPGVRVNSAR